MKIIDKKEGYLPFINGVLEKIFKENYKPTFSKNLLNLYYLKKRFDIDWMFDTPTGTGKYLHFLNEVVSHKNIKTIVELGNSKGKSSLVIWDGLKTNQEFYTFDIIEDLAFVPTFVKKDKKFKFYKVDSLDVNKVSKILTNKKIDLLFIDTIHKFYHLKKEWNFYKEYLSDDSIVLIDDINMSDMLKIREEFKKENFSIVEVKTEKVLHKSGFGIFIVNK